MGSEMCIRDSPLSFSLVSVSVSVAVAVAVCLCLCLCPSLTRGGYTGTYAQVVAHEATCTVLAASRAPAGSDTTPNGNGLPVPSANSRAPAGSDTTPAGGPAEWGKDLGGLADWQVCVSVCLCVCVSASPCVWGFRRTEFIVQEHWTARATSWTGRWQAVMTLL